jgi:hypothetical protein
MTIRKYFDSKYKFAEIFDDKTGFYLRTDILDENGKETGVAPFMRSFPALLDIGIMGKCSSMKTCPVGCYLGIQLERICPLSFLRESLTK